MLLRPQLPLTIVPRALRFEVLHLNFLEVPSFGVVDLLDFIQEGDLGLLRLQVILLYLRHRILFIGYVQVHQVVRAFFIIRRELGHDLGWHVFSTVDGQPFHGVTG